MPCQHNVMAFIACNCLALSNVLFMIQACYEYKVKFQELILKDRGRVGVQIELLYRVCMPQSRVLLSHMKRKTGTGNCKSNWNGMKVLI